MSLARLSLVALLLVLAACSETPPAVSRQASSDGPTPGAASSPRKDDGPVESIGGLRTGLAPAAIVAILGEPASKGPSQEEGATGLLLSEWKWPQAGVAVSMEMEGSGAARSSNFIRVSAPSRLRTPAGVGVGSTRSEVVAAYGARLNAKDSHGDSLIIGSVYGGMAFQLGDGKVVSVIIGNFAE